MHHFIEILIGLKYKMGNVIHTYCINMYGIINQNEKVLNKSIKQR